jgi:NagD protein
MKDLRNKEGFICDMDGVIYCGNRLLPGVKEFVDWLYRENKKFLFLTNSSGYSQKELQQKLHRMGLDVDESHFYTSALATAKFLAGQSPGCGAYVIGEPGLFKALYDAGITVNNVDPEYVVIGETSNYNYDNICQAVRHVFNGAKLIGTNPDLTYPMEMGIAPACGALLAPIEATTKRKAYYVGKPNPLMMRTGLNMLDVHSENAAIIGDRMDTDIVAGIESGLDTALVLSGVTSREIMEHYPYRPRLVLNNVGDIPNMSVKDESKQKKPQSDDDDFPKLVIPKKNKIAAGA